MLRGIPAEFTLIDDILGSRAASPHRIVVSVRVRASPCAVCDAVLIPDQGNPQFVTATEKVLGEIWSWRC